MSTWEEEGFSCPEFWTPSFVTVNVTIRQVQPHEIRKYCGGKGNACFDRGRGIITVPRITNDYDYRVFGSLGHEIWHAMGGKHKR